MLDPCTGLRRLVVELLKLKIEDKIAPIFAKTAKKTFRLIPLHQIIAKCHLGVKTIRRNLLPLLALLIRRFNLTLRVLYEFDVILDVVHALPIVIAR